MLEAHLPKLKPNLSYVEKPVRVLDHKEKVVRMKMIRYVKVLRNEQTEEAIWELEDDMRKKHLELFD